MNHFSRTTLSIAAMLSFGIAAPFFAHGDANHIKNANTQVKKEQKDWGIAGDTKSIKRTIQISMNDSMRFTPDKVVVKLGETVHFVIANKGKIMHEYVIGTKKVLEDHAAMMVKFPTMEHSEPYMAHVGPGKKGEIVWTFNKAGEFDFACLIAGHYQAGMVGKITVKS
jgi:uncharacterized cupredoxin-like copper-binding protein